MQIEYTLNVNFKSTPELIIPSHSSYFAHLVKGKGLYEKQTLPETSILKGKVDNIYVLGGLYIMKNPLEIRSFLFSHDNLIPILFEAPEKIRKIFGNAAELYLELSQDPEEEWEGLFIIIKTNIPPEKSITLLNRFDEEWWLYVDDEISNILEVTVRPI